MSRNASDLRKQPVSEIRFVFYTSVDDKQYLTESDPAKIDLILRAFEKSRRDGEVGADGVDQIEVYGLNHALLVAFTTYPNTCLDWHGPEVARIYNQYREKCLGPLAKKPKTGGG